LLFLDPNLCLGLNFFPLHFFRKGIGPAQGEAWLQPGRVTGSNPYGRRDGAMYATVLMDIEDLVAPEADDLAATCADILHDEGVTATFCIVGEKARLLKRRGRHDVIAALQRHDIAFHTDLHSVHPTIAEYLVELNWEQGVAEALRREQPGVQSIHEVFGVSPSCWGGPGNTWGPAICEAIRRQGIPAFVYAHTRVPAEGVHRFAGLIAYPGGRSLVDGRYQDDDFSRQDLARLQNELQADVQLGRFWQEIFIGHPTRILHEQFWDAPNFANGANPPRNEWRPAPRKSQEALDRALANFRRAVCHIKSLPGIELKTIRQMNAILASAPSHALTEGEREQVWPTIEGNLRHMAGWPILPRGIDLSPICHQTRQLLPTLERFDFGSLRPM
jgi:hypothetical protein